MGRIGIFVVTDDIDTCTTSQEFRGDCRFPAEIDSLSSRSIDASPRFETAFTLRDRCAQRCCIRAESFRPPSFRPRVSALILRAASRLHAALHRLADHVPATQPWDAFKGRSAVSCIPVAVCHNQGRLRCKTASTNCLGSRGEDKRGNIGCIPEITNRAASSLLEFLFSLS